MSTPTVNRQDTLPYKPPQKKSPLKRTHCAFGKDLLKQLGLLASPPPSLEGRVESVEKEDTK